MNILIDDEKLSEARELANRDYGLFRRAFEHGDDHSTNPLLTEYPLFQAFLSDYAIARTVARGKSDAFRKTLRDDPAFGAALKDPTGRLLDQYHEQTLRPRFGTRDSQRGLLSATSKFATALVPLVFVPWDQYAKKGLNVFLGRKSSAQFSTYEEFLGLCSNFLESELALKIRQKSSRDPIFQRRVLDMYLMCLGDYTQSSTTKCS